MRHPWWWEDTGRSELHDAWVASVHGSAGGPGWWGEEAGLHGGLERIWRAAVERELGVHARLDSGRKSRREQRRVRLLGVERGWGGDEEAGELLAVLGHHGGRKVRQGRAPAASTIPSLRTTARRGVGGV